MIARIFRFLAGWVAASVAVSVAVSGAAEPQGTESDDLLENLRAGHPRLLATSDDWAKLRRKIDDDALYARVHATIVGEARVLLAKPPLERKLTGRRLLSVSREMVRRVMTLGYAWQTTRERGFAERAEAEMLAAAEFADWNPSHFLDVAEAAAAVALGYDWCYDVLTERSRETIRRALIEKGLRAGLDPADPHNNWHRVRNNWSQVCFGGLTLAALVVADHEPELAREMLRAARGGIGFGLEPYAPDGVYPEGPSYWVYGTTYQAILIAALESALGTDWGLSKSEGFLTSAGAFLQTTGATGAFYNHGDGREQGRHEAVIYWFARKISDPGLAFQNVRRLNDDELLPEFDQRSWFFPLTAIWWPEEPLREVAPKLPLRWHGRGENPIAVFRESWTDRNSLYLALKGGAAELNHAHMDVGSFVLERDGVRWVIELGMQDYNSLESKGIDLWNRAQDSQRWQVYRLNNHSHSTLTIDGRLHRVDGHATITEFVADGETPWARVDLSPAFRGQAERVVRMFRLLPGRRVAIADELSGLTPGATVRWQIPTRAEVLPQGNEAVLKQDERTLKVRLAADKEVELRAEPAAAPKDDFNAANPGVSLLVAELVAPPDGTLRFVATLGEE